MTTTTFSNESQQRRIFSIGRISDPVTHITPLLLLMCFTRPHICDERLFGYSVYPSYPLNGKQFCIFLHPSPECQRRNSEYGCNLFGTQEIFL